MKVLLIHNTYQQAGGEDTVFRAEGELLEKHGHEVERIVFDNKSIVTKVDRLRAALGIFYNPVSARRVRAVIGTFRPDVMHVHNFVPIASPSIFYVAAKLKVPTILTVHNYRLLCPSATLFYEGTIYEKSLHSAFPFDAVLKGVYRNSRSETLAVALHNFIHSHIGTWKKKIDRYVLLTNFAREIFVQSRLAIPPEKLVVKPNFMEDPGEGDAERDRYFLFIGRLSVEKGIMTLLEASRKSSFRIVIIGDGPLREKVEAECGLNSRLTYLGFQDKATIVTYLKKCTALLFPSLWYEGFPMTILEAFATGTPVIASRLGSMPEIITDQINGLLFTPADSSDLADKMTTLQNAQESRSLFFNARHTYLQNFTPEKSYKQLMSIYDDVNNSRTGK